MGETTGIEWTSGETLRQYVSRLAGRQLGLFKRAARMAGVTLPEYLDLYDSGLKRCSRCRTWKPHDDFGADTTRWDGKDAKCLICRKAIHRFAYAPVKPEDRLPMGPPRDPIRAGDKLQARHFINLDVRMGRRPNPNELYCAKCGHKGEGRRHEYHHHLGYEPEHFYDVLPLCSRCHRKADYDESRRRRNCVGQYASKAGDASNG